MTVEEMMEEIAQKIKIEELESELVDAYTASKAATELPQPAGHIVATWFNKEQPHWVQLLYIIARLLTRIDNLVQNYRNQQESH